tara:strand:- start:1069 stop:1194 length:126 start_codon:yes stop_codon:yes gene_type:complete
MPTIEIIGLNGKGKTLDLTKTTLEDVKKEIAKTLTKNKKGK